MLPLVDQLLPMELNVLPAGLHHQTGRRFTTGPLQGRGITMKKSAITTAIAAGFAAALFGLAAPANAGIDHHSWLNDIQQEAVVGSATSTVGNGR
jgi:hypothetical protein